jgi:hypothetical protein
MLWGSGCCVGVCSVCPFFVEELAGFFFPGVAVTGTQQGYCCQCGEEGKGTIHVKKFGAFTLGDNVLGAISSSE